MILSELKASARRAAVELALPGVLKGLIVPVGTAEVVERVCRALDTKERALVSRTLVALAPTIPEAGRSSATFKRYGRTMTRLVWSPREGA